MEKVIKEHQSSNTFKCCVYSGNNSKMIQRLLGDTFNVEFISPDDEKYAMQMSNFIWK